jgi:hypothetical protein
MLTGLAREAVCSEGRCIPLGSAARAGAPATNRSLKCQGGHRAGARVGRARLSQLRERSSQVRRRLSDYAQLLSAPRLHRRV